MAASGRVSAARKCRPAVLAVVAGLMLMTGPAFGQAREADLDDLGILLPTINDALETARSGQPVTWSNPKTGNRGEIEVLRTFYRADDIPCRDYKRLTERADNSARLVQGTGCRIEDGFWKLEESESRVIRAPGPVEDVKAPVAEEARTTPRPLPSKPKDIVPAPDTAAIPEPTPAKTPPPAPAPESKPAEIVARLPQPAAE